MTVISEITRHPASFRDPLGTVYNLNGKIIRGLSPQGVLNYSAVKKTGLITDLEKSQRLIKSQEINLINLHPNLAFYLEHEVIPFISYPYEWPFLLLKDAALLHLSIQIEALGRNVVLTDATAFNIQFKGVCPIFIDLLSFRPYEKGELWNGHSQFCQQFLNPLLLYAIKDTSYQNWYKGNMDGIPGSELAKMLPLRYWFSLRYLIHVLLPARSQKFSDKKNTAQLQELKKTSLPKSAYASFLTQLYRWIEDLKPKNESITLWENYSKTRIYNSQEILSKKEFIADFVQKVKPTTLWDLGCNDGEFAEVALKNGAESVIGFDVDLGALNKAVLRAKEKKLNFLPLYQQINNPSPMQGWLSKERSSITERGKPDAVTALAFLHHLVIGHNIIFSEAIDWLVDLAPQGVIEFVHKSDPTIQQMLALREDIFCDYCEENFVIFLQKKAKIIKKAVISDTGRTLFWFKRHDG